MSDTADSDRANYVERVEHVYSRMRVLSLDVAAAALGGGIVAVRVIGTEPRRAFYLLLPSSVWVVYTLDHLLDARRMGPGASTPRHRFHYCHAKVLWVATVVIAAACGIVGVVELSTTGIIFGATIASLFGVHELIVKLAGSRAAPWLVKELGVAVIFSAGTWGLPLMLHHQTTGLWGGWPVEMLLQYFLLACVNLIEFSIYEARSDASDRQTSFVLYAGRARAGQIAMLMLAAQIPLGVYALTQNSNRVALTTECIFAAMTVGLWSVLRFPRFAAKRERYRAVGDGVFMLPLLAFFL